MALQLRRGTNAERLLITPQQGELIFVTDYLAVNIVGTTIASDLQTITFSANHNITVLNTKLLFQSPTQNGLTQGTVYYVKSIPAVNQLTLSTTSGGTTLNMPAGTGLTLTFNKTPTNASGTPVGNVSPLWIGNGTTVGGLTAQVSVLDDLLDVTLTSLQEGQTLYYDADTAQWKNTGIIKINDTGTGVEIDNTAGTRTRRTTTSTATSITSLTVSGASTGTATAGFGTAIAFENEIRPNVYQVGAYITSEVRDTTSSNEDSRLNFTIQTAGGVTTPLVLEGYDATVSGNLYLKGDNTTDTYIDFVHPSKTGRLAWEGSGLFINGNFDVAGTGTNGQVDLTAGSGTTMGIANLFNNTGIGTINIGNGSTTEVNIGNSGSGRTQIKSQNLELVGDIRINGNDIKSSTGNTAITLNDYDVIVAGDLQVNGNNGGSSADVVTTKATASLFPANATTVNLATASTALTLGATTGTTTIRNNASVTLDATIGGDLTVNGGEIKINGVANGSTQPFLTFETQGASNTKLNGVRGKSSQTDAWFVGGGGAGDDLGYLEIATGDNAGESYSGGQIYVRQYNNGASAPFGVPWEGGTGVAVNTLTLLDNYGNTTIPRNLEITQGSITTQASSASLFSTGGQPSTIDFGASASTLNMGSSSGTTTVRNNLTVSGNLTVNGTTTTVNSTTVTVDDKNIELGSVASPTDTTAQGGGITLRGATDKTIIWNNSTDGWDFNQNISSSGVLALDGSYLTLRNSSTGTPTTGDDAFFYVKRGDTGQPAFLGWYESNDTWYFNNNLQVANNFTANSATISGVQIAKNALTDNVGYRVSVAKGNDLVIQSGSTLIANSDYIRFQRNTSRASSITSNVISGFNGGLHNFNVGDRIQYTGATGNGLTQDAYYYVVATSFTTSDCRLATTLNGTPITLTNGTGLNLSFWSEGGLGNAYFNLSAGQYAFNRETPSGSYNLEVEGTFNATGNTVIGGDLAVNGGDITTTSTTATLYGTNATTVYMAGSATYVGIGASTGNTVIGNSLTVGANTIRASDGAIALTLSQTTGDVTVAGDLTVVGNDIKYSNGSTQITLASGGVVFAGDIQVNGNDIKSSTGATAITLTGSDVAIAGNLTVNGTTTTLNSTTLTVDDKNIEMGSVATPTDTTASGGGITLKGATDKTIIWNNASTGWEFNQPIKVTGNAVLTGDLDVQGADITNSTGALQLTTSTNNHIKLTPNGTGNVLLEATTVQIGESTGAQLTTSSSDLRLDTANGSNSGYINIAAGVNGEITIAPNGTGITNVTGNLQVSGNTIKKSSGTDVITFSGTNLTTLAGGAVVTGDIAVNGGDITTTSTTATLFSTNATSLTIGSSGTTVSYTGLVTHSGTITDLAGTTTLTQTTPYNLTSTTRRGMKLLLNITDTVTKDVHMIEVLLVTKVVGGVGTVYMTTFGEVTSAGQLATFSADSNGTTTYFYVTPLSTNSTTVAYSRRSI